MDTPDQVETAELSTEQVADQLGVSSATIRRYARCGLLDYQTKWIGLKKEYRFTLEAVRRFRDQAQNN